MVTHPAERTPVTINPHSQTWQGPFVGPGVPPTPISLVAPPRSFDYISGVNANVIPRTEYGQWIPDFYQLWWTYEHTDLIKVATTYRRNQILSLSWNVSNRKGASQYSTRGAESFRKLLEKPDAQNGYNFEAWLGSLIEEVYVTDALTIAPVRNRLGRVVAFRQIDGSTIKPLIDESYGAPPAPPEPAYVQYIKGTPYAAFTSEELIYKPFSPRSWCIYGRPHVENVINSMWLYMLHENWVGDYFRQGNMPEQAAILDPAQSDITDEAKFLAWQQTMDEKSGVNVGRRRIHLMPPFIKDVKALKAFSYDRELSVILMRILSVEYGVPTYVFASETNKATAEQVSEALSDTALRKELQSWKRFFDGLAESCDLPEIEFNWSRDPNYDEKEVKGLVLMTSPPPGGYANSPNFKPIMERDEARAYLGLEAEEGGEMEGGATGDGGDDGDEDEQGGAQEDPDAEQENPEAGGTDEDQRKAAGGGNVLQMTGTTKARLLPSKAGKKFKGPGARDKRRLAMELAPVVFKRLRTQEAEVLRLAMQKARGRGKKVIGAPTKAEGAQ